MAKLVNQHGDVLTSIEDVTEEVKGFYETLYKKRDVDDCGITDLITDLPQLHGKEYIKLTTTTKKRKKKKVSTQL